MSPTGKERRMAKKAAAPGKKTGAGKTAATATATTKKRVSKGGSLLCCGKPMKEKARKAKAAKK